MRADDRLVEHPGEPLRPCKFAADDPRYLKDCQRCAHEVGAAPVVENVTPVYAGSSELFRTTKYYAKASYQSVPIRANFECDWPYAARRYNGSGINSYHYQLRILRYLRSLTTGSPAAELS
jgi:hypothetical protein